MHKKKGEVMEVKESLHLEKEESSQTSYLLFLSFVPDLF